MGYGFIWDWPNPIPKLYKLLWFGLPKYFFNIYSVIFFIKIRNNSKFFLSK